MAWGFYQRPQPGTGEIASFRTAWGFYQRPQTGTRVFLRPEKEEIENPAWGLCSGLLIFHPEFEVLKTILMQEIKT